ncbi:MAG: YciI family protein [Anaerolineales bacterium]|nr:YciI family protein [Anaerolineales bacterium]
MQYLLLIYADEKAHAARLLGDPAAMQAEMAEYYAFGDAARKAGVLRAGEALHMTDQALTVRVRGGQTLKTHGPFAETKEQLGGYYLVECANLDQAIEWAARLPGARDGSVEIRPVVDFSQAGD